MVLRRLGLAACCAMMVALVSAAGARAAEGDDARIAALLGLSDARIKAVVEADTQQLSALLSDDLRYTHSNGSVDTKDEFIAALTSGRSNYHSFAPFDRVFTFPAPGIALESGKALIAVEGTAGKLDALFSYLAVWREEQGTWRFVAWQSARLPQGVAPAGFVSLFNGRDLAGWRGRPHLDPAEEQAATPAETASRQAGWNADLASHWSVKNGVIVSDGQGVYLTTDRDYADFELLVDWMLPGPCADSGIYLRGNPQVQIWDPDCARDVQHGNEKGSGGLWNNPPDSPGKFPLARADRPTGQWNTTRIRMQGEKVTVVLNDQVVVDNQPLANFFAAGKPLPERGAIQFQTHGAPMHLRNISIRELTTTDGSGPGWRDLGEADFVNVNCDADTWSWKDGVARCTGKPVGVIRSREPLTNLEMALEWRHLSPGGNSGVFLWAPPAVFAGLKPGTLPPGGIEVQVLDHAYTQQYEASGAKADWFTTDGDVFPVGSSSMKPFPPVAPQSSRSFPTARHSRGTPEWNHYFIRAINGEVRLWVNGHEVSGGSGCTPATGHLCLESEGAPVEFRRMRIRQLP